MRGLPLPLITAVFSFHVFRSVRMQTALTAQLLWRINLSAFPASILALNLFGKHLYLGASS